MKTEIQQPEVVHLDDMDDEINFENLFEQIKVNNFLSTPFHIDEIELNKLDKGIRKAVEVLNFHGFLTFESCDGSTGHIFTEPTVRFFGEEIDLIRAWEICKLYNLKPFHAKRVYRKTPIYEKDYKIKGLSWDKPFNEITFKK